MNMDMDTLVLVVLLCVCVNQIIGVEVDNGIPSIDEDIRPPLFGGLRPPFLPEGQVPVPPPNRPVCNYAYRCSNEENVQWATDGLNCFVFRNECHLASTNCDRKNQFIKVLANVDKDECQRLCRDICPLDYRPVCAIYNNKPRTFNNSCTLDSHICQTGETYNFYRVGECPYAQQTTTNN